MLTTAYPIHFWEVEGKYQIGKILYTFGKNWSKIEILIKHINFNQNTKFSSNIKIYVKIRNFDET